MRLKALAQLAFILFLLFVEAGCHQGVHPPETQPAIKATSAASAHHHRTDAKSPRLFPKKHKRKNHAAGTSPTKQVQESFEPKASSGGSSSSEKKGKAHSQSSEVIVVFTTLVCLVLAAICREIKKFSGFPFTPLLLMAGMLCGGYTHKLGVFGEGLEIILNIDPHGILLIFIPILVFEAAYNTDLYFFKKEFYQVLTLAGPGVAVGAVLLALVFNYVLGYHETINIYGALTFGSIICATDTVAVLALLKELGAPKYFSCLFEGENLLNDATAMVFYMIFSNLFKAQGMTPTGAILQFLRLSVGGFLLGGGVFLIVIVWLSRITKDKILVIVITIASCFLTFYIAENVVMVSGLLAVVVLGVFMAMHAKMRMNHEAAEMVHTVISFIQFCLESVLFLITGVFIGKMFVFQDQNTLGPEDYTKSLIFFAFMNLARYLMINLLLPLINKSGYPLNWKDVIILSYGGVRGALGLALALIVYRDTEFDPHFRDLVLFNVAVVIVLTMIFNGLTIGYVMRLINFSPINPLTFKIRSNVLKNLVVSSMKKREAMKQSQFLKLADWEEVKTMCGLETIIRLQQREEETVKKNEEKSGRVELKELKIPLREADFDKVEVEEVRMRYYNMVKSLLFEKFKEDYCSIATLKVLNESIEVCIEDLSRPLWMWENVSQDLMSVGQIMYLIKLRNIPLIGRFTSSYFTRYFLSTYEKLSMFVMVLNQILDEKVEMPFQLVIVNMVLQEVYKNKSKFESRLFYLCDLFPEFITSVQTRQAAQIILNSQKSLLHESYENGYITEDDYIRLTNLVEKESSNLDLKPYNWSTKEINELELIEPTFSKLNKEYLQKIKESYVKCQFKSGDTIFSKGDVVRGIYIIFKGIVEDNLTLDTRISLGVGGIVSFANVVTADGRSLTTLNCIKDCSAYLVPKDLILTIAENDRNFKHYVYKNALYYFLKVFGSVSFNTNLNDSIIMVLVDSSEMICKSKGELVCVDGGGFLFKGNMRPVSNPGVKADVASPGKPHKEENEPAKDASGSPGPETLQPEASKQESPSLLSPSPASPQKKPRMHDHRVIISAPLLVNPLMNGYYKVEEPVVFFSFKNAGLGEEQDSTGSLRFSLRNQMVSMSMAGMGRRTSFQKKLTGHLDMDKQYKEVIAELLPQDDESEH